MEHSNELSLSPHEWKNQIHQDGAMRCIYKIRRCNSNCMDVSYARMWIIHKPMTIKNERRRANTNKGYTIPRWDIMQQLVVMVQAEYPKVSIQQIEGLEVCRA